MASGTLHLRSLRLAVLIALVCLASACSSDSSDGAPLQGVDDATAEKLCNSFLDLGDATNLLSGLDADEVRATATSYRGLAEQARGDKAAAFAAIVEEAAKAADAFAEMIDEDQLQDNGNAVLAKSYRLQLADVTLRLACAERGFTVFRA